MTLEDLRKIPLLQTRTIAEALKDKETLLYVLDCLERFYAGDYGEMCEDDIIANNSDLQYGAGHVLARYKGKHQLQGDFYIESHFDTDYLEDINYTNTLIMYPEER